MFNRKLWTNRCCLERERFGFSNWKTFPCGRMTHIYGTSLFHQRFTWTCGQYREWIGNNHWRNSCRTHHTIAYGHVCYGMIDISNPTSHHAVHIRAYFPNVLWTEIHPGLYTFQRRRWQQISQASFRQLFPTLTETSGPWIIIAWSGFAMTIMLTWWMQGSNNAEGVFNRKASNIPSWLHVPNATIMALKVRFSPIHHRRQTFTDIVTERLITEMRYISHAEPKQIADDSPWSYWDVDAELSD